MELRVENLCKSYGGEAVLQDLSFTASAGVTCIMAPSGTGKTTLLRILMGLERADSGAVCGMENCRISAAFQEDRLIEHLDAMGNLRFALGASLDEAAAWEALAQLGLADVQTKRVREYSGGMKRRLALARALLAPAELLVLDEPFTGLDEENRIRAIGCIRRAAAGKIVLLVTHEETDAAALEAGILRL